MGTVPSSLESSQDSRTDDLPRAVGPSSAARCRPHDPGRRNQPLSTTNDNTSEGSDLFSRTGAEDKDTERSTAPSGTAQTSAATKEAISSILQLGTPGYDWAQYGTKHTSSGKRLYRKCRFKGCKVKRIIELPEGSCSEEIDGRIISEKLDGDHCHGPETLALEACTPEALRELAWRVSSSREENPEKIPEHMKTFYIICAADLDVFDDGFSWRKYGEKNVKGFPYKRSYYRCSTAKSCEARKTVEFLSVGTSRATYKALHNHVCPSGAPTQIGVSSTVDQTFGAEWTQSNSTGHSSVTTSFNIGITQSRTIELTEDTAMSSSSVAAAELSTSVSIPSSPEDRGSDRFVVQRKLHEDAKNQDHVLKHNQQLQAQHLVHQQQLELLRQHQGNERQELVQEYRQSHGKLNHSTQLRNGDDTTSHGQNDHQLNSGCHQSKQYRFHEQTQLQQQLQVQYMNQEIRQRQLREVDQEELFRATAEKEIEEAEKARHAAEEKLMHAPVQPQHLAEDTEQQLLFSDGFPYDASGIPDLVLDNCHKRRRSPDRMENMKRRELGT